MVKHAYAKNVTIIADYKNIELYTFQIIDDGVGFSAENGEYGVGIPSMADRVKMLGGKFDIESAEGKGTRIVMEVPVSDE